MNIGLSHVVNLMSVLPCNHSVLIQAQVLHLKVHFKETTQEVSFYHYRIYIKKWVGLNYYHRYEQ